MDEKEMTQPALPDRRQAGSRAGRVLARRVSPVVGIALLGVLVATGVSPAADAGPAAPAQGAVVPGLDPPVQRWFKDREGLRIELNNALQQTQKLPRPASAARPACTRLLKAAGLLTAFSRVPSAPLDVPVRAGLDQFVQGATACLAGDLPRAEQLIAQGLAARTAVSEQIDEILDGD
jgi:uncharacterized membrane protein